MKFRRYIYILLISIISLAGIDYAVEANAMDSSAETTGQVSRSKKKSSKKSRKKSRKKSKKNRRSKSGRKKKRSSKKRAGSRKKRSSSRSSHSTPAERPSNDSLTLLINAAVLESVPSDQNPGGLRVNSVKPDKKNRIARLSLNENFTYLPVTQELIKKLSSAATEALPDSLSDYRVTLTVGNRSLAYYISKIDKLPADKRKNPPFVVAAAPWANPKHGMEGDIVALWHSHGRYFRPGSGSWMWQRPILFQSIEDTYTMSYILPFVVPMLENAGAYVLLPRERDVNRHEVIVDNDTFEGGQVYSQPYYKEMKGSTSWETGSEEGFIYDLPDFRDTENPFENGTYRQTTTTKGGKPSVAAWYADIPEDGEYAVYVSYKTLPESTTDAHYTVNYSGGTRDFRVNQTMGGSTWVYVGTFPFKAGYSDKTPIVTLSNLTEGKAGTIVTADAVKIGGGMGNIARSNNRSDIYYDPSTPIEDTNQSIDNQTEEETEDEEVEGDEGDESDEGDETEETEETEETDENPDGEAANPSDSQTGQISKTQTKKGPAPVFRTSGMPRFLEGARYWMQWSGIPESVYSPYHGRDDYKDDYTSRGGWVNYLAGGSRVLPNREGLNIPIDLAMALHTDAGKRSDDSTVGTLGIYYSNGGTSYADGTPRMNSRILTDMLMRQITGDIRKSYEPQWTRRSMWDKSYLEARVPEVPTALIELLSHQNYGDMLYGLDPGFRFTVGRAIYKALGRFISERKDREFIVQPLPPSAFSIVRTKKGHYRLSWKATPDSLEPTAMPSKYIILERTGNDLGFHKIGETKNTHYDVRTKDELIHSFRVIAVNDGGLSFPTETLAMRENGSKPVLIVNGFERISGPSHFNEEGRAGFDADDDFGVPYIRDIGFTGNQYEFRRSAGESFGRSSSDYITAVIAGNTFDYPYIHGQAISASDKGFVSCSAKSIENGTVKLHDYKLVDWILGKQKTTIVGSGKSGIRYATFSSKQQNLIENYLDHGGRLMVSGAYVGSDLQTGGHSAEGTAFSRDVLGINVDHCATRQRGGNISITSSALSAEGEAIPYSNTLNEHIYIVENPDVISPTKDSELMFTFTDTGLPAGVMHKYGKGKVAVSSIPFESLTRSEDRKVIMEALMEWLSK